MVSVDKNWLELSGCHYNGPDVSEPGVSSTKIKVTLRVLWADLLPGFNRVLLPNVLD